MHKLAYKIVLPGLLLLSSPLIAQKEFNALDHVLQKRPKVDTIPDSRWYDNLFLSGGIGVEGIVNGVSIVPGRSRVGLTGAISVGKWFNSVSALRIGLQASIPQHQIKEIDRRYFVHGGITADYMANLSNYLYGYNPDRIFNFMPFVGAGVHLTAVTRDQVNASASVRGGFQASFRVSQGLDLFVEPIFQVYTDGYNHQKNWRRFDVVPAFMAGLTYTMIPRESRTNVSPFYNDALFDNLFFSVGAGGGILINGFTVNRLFYNHVGPELSVSVGNWFTPVSGARLSVTGNVYKESGRYLTMFGGQLDYMLNFDALFEGYHANRLFRLYGIAGLNVAFPEKTGKTANTVGIGVGVQGNFRLSSTTDFFIEPRLNLYPDKFAGGFTNSKFDMPATLLVGFTYRRPDNGSYRKGEFKDNKWEDNTFLSGGIGVNAPISGFVRSIKMDAVQPFATLSFGKWFTPVSGLRLNGQIGLLGETNTQGRYARTKLGGLGLDYLLNVSNFIGGYNPDRIVSLRASLGGSALFNTATDKNSEHGFEFGLVGGVQGTVKVSPSLDLYLEPKLGLFTKGLTNGAFPPLSGDLLASVSAGLIYNFQNYDLATNRAAFGQAGGDSWFFSFGGGVGTIVNSAISTWGVGPAFELSIGNQYSPLSAWRAGLRYNKYPELPKKKGGKKQTYVGVDGDYLLDLTTLSTGYRADRIFRLQGIVGVSAGIADSRDDVKFVPGVHAALNASLRLNDFLSVYIEPRMDMLGKHFVNNNNSRNFDATISGLVGLSWSFR